MSNRQAGIVKQTSAPKCLIIFYDSVNQQVLSNMVIKMFNIMLYMRVIGR